MTPAIRLLEKQNIPHRVHSYEHDSQHNSYGMEAAEKLELSPEQVFKTLIVTLDQQQLAVAIVPVGGKLNLKTVAKSLKSKKAVMADQAAAERATGYIVGGISPLGQKKRLPTLIDQSASVLKSLFVSAGRRGLEIEISPHDLQQLTRATFADIGIFEKITHRPDK